MSGGFLPSEKFFRDKTDALKPRVEEAFYSTGQTPIRFWQFHLSFGRRKMRSRGTATFAVISAVATTTFLATLAAWAQTATPYAGAPPLRVTAAKALSSANDRQVYLVRQDQSDCTNTTVPSGDSPNVGGNLWLTRDSSGNTTVKVAITASPDTTYLFNLKCVKQLGTITTGDEGEGIASFTFPTNSVGATYGFDMYPNGAPAGNKFQSATVNF
jgi:hypothetical protein